MGDVDVNLDRTGPRRWSVTPGRGGVLQWVAALKAGLLRRPHRLMAETLNELVFKSCEYEAISLQNILLA